MKINKINKINIFLAMGIAGIMACTSSGTAYGLNQTEQGSQVTMYGIGSTSKVIVTAAVMKLAEEGQLDLDSPLTYYIPEFEMSDERYKNITPRMLLDHTSGLQGSTLTNAMLLGDNDTDNHDHLIKRLKSQRLKAEPGAFGTYCNDGFTLAEILVERVTGLSFTEYLQQEMTEPLGLNRIKTPQSPSSEKNLASIYDSKSGVELPAEAANVIGSGGIYATAEDLVQMADIFTRDQKAAKGIISSSTAEAMEDSSYNLQWNPEGRDSNLSYGLGWDSVETYPFNRYGVKALVKGGDTVFYHGSLTVLPEENITCAVLSSGGSSAYNQLAVQEILLTYLDEIQRIDRDEEGESRELEGDPAFFIENGPNDINSSEIQGWYAGNILLNMSMEQPDQMKLELQDHGHKRTQTYELMENGSYISTDGYYINSMGEFAKGSNGRIGRTYLNIKADEKGKNYLMAGIYEKYPRLGIMGTYQPFGEQLAVQTPSTETVESWKPYDGKHFYLVSDKYTSTAYLSRTRVRPLLNEPEGYLTFENGDLNMAQLTGVGKSRFFQQVAGQAGRDLADYEIVKKDGKSYLSTSSSRYIEESSIESISKEAADIVIGENGESIWYSLGEQQQNPVIIKGTPEGAWYVYDETGREARAVTNSWTIKDRESFILPKKGKIVFVGDPGASFSIAYLK